jgi:diaminopimelate epimerase
MTELATLPFRKMNGLGNEIVVIDFRGSDAVLTEGEARAIASRPESHFDQLMALHDPRTAGSDAYVRIYNADGSSAGACGNGMRCIGWVVSRDLARADVKFETQAGLLDVHVDSLARITVDMGEPRFRWDEIPLAEPFRDTRHIELQIGPIDKPILHSPSAVSIGNPHAVFWVDDVEAYDLGRIGPLLEHHPIFPDRANISLAHVTSPTSVTVRTWERGAGLTRACGSGACAVAVSAARTGRTERTVAVRVPGGVLEIAWTDANRVLMTGPAELEYEGRIDRAGLHREVA